MGRVLIRLLHLNYKLGEEKKVSFGYFWAQNNFMLFGMRIFSYF